MAGRADPPPDRHCLVATTVRGTTGTAPIQFDCISATQVLIILEDGSQQIYRLADLIAVLVITEERNPKKSLQVGDWADLFRRSHLAGHQLFEVPASN